MSALEIILLLVVIILGGLLLFELYKRRQMNRQVNQMQSDLHDRTQKLEALNTAFTTRKMVEGNLGEKLRDLTDYIQEVQDTYAAELDANTALVSGMKAELNPPETTPPPQLSEDNQADEINATLSESTQAETTEATEPKPKDSKSQESEPKESETPKASEKPQKSSDPAPISMEVQAPTDTHVDRKAAN